jgi:parallel beta-helix repeat protein
MLTQSGIDKRVLAFGKVENTDKQYMPIRVDAQGQMVIPSVTLATYATELRTANLKLYEYDANTLSLENLAGGTRKNLQVGDLNATSITAPTGRTATYVIAFPGSSAEELAQANVVGTNALTGTTDNSLFDTALTILNVNSGGTLYFTGRALFCDEVLVSYNNIRITSSKNASIDLYQGGTFVNFAFGAYGDNLEFYHINFWFTDTTAVAITRPPDCIRGPVNPTNATNKNVNIHDCSLIGINTAGVSGGLKHTTIGKAIDPADGSYWTINNNYFYGCSWESVSIGFYSSVPTLYHPDHITVTNNQMTGLSDRCYGGVVTEHGATNCVISNNTISNMGAGDGYGIYAIAGNADDPSNGVVISGNKINNCSFAGILLGYCNNVEVSGNIITGTYLTTLISPTLTDIGIYVGGESSCVASHVNINGNIITGTIAQGILVANSSNDINITGNTIKSIRNIGIELYTCRNINIKSNTISYVYYENIKLSSGHTQINVKIQNNSLSNCSQSASSWKSIRLIGTVTNAWIESNSIFDSNSLFSTTINSNASIGDGHIHATTVQGLTICQNILLADTGEGTENCKIADIDYINKIIYVTALLTKNHTSGAALTSPNLATYVINIDPAATCSNIIVANNNWLNYGASGITGFWDTTTKSKISKVINNEGYIAPGEIRTYSGTITTLTENAFNALDNPFRQAVRVLSLDIYVSTAATATSPNIDCGIGSSATTDYTTLFDDLPGETIGFYKSTIATPGTQTVPQLWASGSGDRYITMSIKGAAATGMVASYTVTVMGI